MTVPRACSALVAVVCLLLVAGCESAGLFELPPAPGPGFLEGRITRAVAGNSEGEPLVGAEIGVFRSNRATLTDTTGSFSLGPLPPGTYRLLLRANVDGEIRQRFLEQVTVGARAKALGEVQLQQNGEVLGRVRFEGTVAGTGTGTVVFAPGLFVTGLTLPDGSYLLRGVPEGLVSIAAFREQMDVAQLDQLEVVGGQRVFASEMVLRPLSSTELGVIEGTVFLHEGASGVVQVSAVRAADPQTVIARATAENDGKWNLARVPPGVYDVRVELDGVPSTVIPNVPVGAGRTTPINGIQLFPAVPGQMEHLGEVEAPDAGTPDAGTPDGGEPVDGGSGGEIGAECRADRDCDSGRLCLLGRCAGCDADSQCRAGFVCRAGDCVRSCGGVLDCPSTLACIGGTCTGCETTLDCRDPLVCANGTCRACETSRECPFGRACVTGICQECANDTQCGAGFLCERGRCTAGECRQALDCPEAGQACEQGACVAACTSRTNCRPGRVCADGACEAGNCVGRTDCAPGELCSNLICGPCTSDVACAAGELCLTGRCVTAECRVPSDCAGGLTCLSNRCVPCSRSSECAADHVCSEGLCVEGDCLDRGACEDGRICSEFRCSPCTGDETCASGELCLEGRCESAECRTESDCGAGALCVQNFCVPCVESASCGSGRVCVGGACTAGNCVDRSDCDPGVLCNTTTNQCEPCTTDGACADGELCESGLCLTGTCHTAADCSNGAQLCHPSTRTCVPCSRSPECGEGRVCFSGACVAGSCTSRAECTGGQLCSATTHACEPCANDGQCNVGERCYAGACLPGTCLTESDCTGGALCSSVTRTCVPCANHGECGFGRVCKAGGCVAGDCAARADCDPGEICSASNRCEPCATDGQCAAGERCYAGQCLTGTCKAESDCSGGRLCSPTTRQCVPCTASSQCGTGRVCLAGGCISGNCTARADCPTGQLCPTSTHTCAPCANDGECGSGERCYAGQCLTGTCKSGADCSGGLRLCDATTRTCAACTRTAECGSDKVCVSGDCLTGDCVTRADCATGQVCSATRRCGPCGSDGQCASGELCYAGVCRTGECKSDADCSGGAALCNTTTRACEPCTNSTQCGAGRICEAGACVAGNCGSSADCTGGKVCLSRVCANCTLDAQCTSGRLCLAGACTVAECRVDTDCVSPKACKNNACVGNCRANTDCSGGQVCQPSGLCAACTANVQCGSGKVCKAGGCVSGSCAADSDCSVGSLCNGTTNTCYAVAPTEAARGTLGLNTGAITSIGLANHQPMVGRNVYYLGNESGLRINAVDPLTLATKWTYAIGGNYPSIGAVMPAKGFANGGEIYVAGRSGGQFALAGADGELLYNPGEAGGGLSVGLIDGVVHLAWQNQGGAFTSVMRYDGKYLQSGVSTGNYCSGWRYHPVWVADGAFVVTCGSGLFLLDAKTLTVRATLAVTFSDWAPMSFWKPPTGPGMLVVAGIVAGVQKLLAYDVTATTLTPRWSFDTTIDSLRALPMIDSAGNTLFFTATGAWVKLDRAGLVLARGTNSPFRSSFTTLLRTGEVMGLDAAGRLISIAPTSTDGGNAFTTRWTLAPPSGGYRTDLYPTFAPNGDLLAWLTPLGSNSLLTRLHAADDLPLQPPAGVFPTFRGAGVGAGAPVGTQCDEDLDCGATQQCVLGSCVGDCRTANDCAAGYGCVNGWCASCGVADGCRANESCHLGACYSCNTGAGDKCCRRDSECTAAEKCNAGRCGPVATTAWAKVNLLGIGTTLSISASGDGARFYVLQPGYTVHAFDRDGNALWTTPPTLPVANGRVAPPLVQRYAGETTDTLFWMNDTSRRLARIDAAGAITTSVDLGHVSHTPISTGKNGAQRLIYGVDRTQSRIFAVDADTLTLAWWNATGCTATYDAPLVGTDNTVYQLCMNGSVQAWNPNGDPNLVIGGVRQGKLLWASASRGWTDVGPFSQIHRAAGATTDRIYMHRFSNGYVITSIPVSAAAPGTMSESAVVWRGPFLVDRSGNVLLLNGWEANFTVLAPDMSTRTFVDVVQAGGARELNFQLDSDGILYTQGNNYRIEAWQVTPQFGVTKLFDVPAPGGGLADSYALTLLPGGRLIADAQIGTGQRSLFALDMPNRKGPAAKPANAAALSMDTTWRFSLAPP